MSVNTISVPALLPQAAIEALSPEDAKQVLILVHAARRANSSGAPFKERLREMIAVIQKLHLESENVKTLFSELKRLLWDEASLAFRVTFVGTLVGSTGLAAFMLATGKSPKGGFVAPSIGIKGVSVDVKIFMVGIIMASATAGVAVEEIARMLESKCRGETGEG